VRPSSAFLFTVPFAVTGRTIIIIPRNAVVTNLGLAVHYRGCVLVPLLPAHEAHIVVRQLNVCLIDKFKLPRLRPALAARRNTQFVTSKKPEEVLLSVEAQAGVRRVQERHEGVCLFASAFCEHPERALVADREAVGTQAHLVVRVLKEEGGVACDRGGEEGRCKMRR
jgi:hypothetical protein